MERAIRFELADLPDTLTAKVDGAVVILTLNRPEKRNALDRELRAALRRAFDAYDQREDLRCAVLTGAGTAFCAGADLAEMSREAMAIPGAEMNLLLGSAGAVSKPVIAAVNGFALAGGFRLALDCDIVLAASTAVFGVTEVRRGRGAPWSAPLKDMISSRLFMELLLTGEPIDAARAERIGLINRSVSPAALLPEAIGMARTIAENAPLSVAASKRLVKLCAEYGLSDALNGGEELFHDVYLSEDAQEGPLAFAEKRRPVWKNR
jgi:enoyl-CoA hydratase/carnithine racemase